MNSNIFKMLITIAVAISFVLVFACNNEGNQLSDGDNHLENTHENANEKHDHAEGESTIVRLSQDQMRAVGITLGEIENKNLTATIRANGVLRVPNKNSANATSLFGGVIKTLKVELGDQVRKGQIIATIENPAFVQLQEDYLTIDNDITLAQQEVDRQKELNAGNAGTKRNLQNATATLNNLQTRRASLYKQMEMMGINPTSISRNSLQHVLVVSSPISGIISNVFSKIGSYVDVSSPVAEIVDNSQLHLDLQVFEKDLPNIKIGQLISFAITNNPSTSYSAKVYNIGSSFQNASKTIAVHSAIQGDKKGLIDGMNITAMVDIDDVAMPTLPDDAIVEADGKFFIFVHLEESPRAADNQTNQNRGAVDEHDHSKEKQHNHKPGQKHDHEAESNAHGGEVSFEKIEIAKGVSYMGYTAITPVKEISPDAKVVTKAAFFINAKMGGSVGHEH